VDTDTEINILSKEDLYEAILITSYNSSQEIFSSITRKWYGGNTVHVQWSFLGNELKIKHSVSKSTSYIPIITFINCKHDILPTGSTHLTVKDPTIISKQNHMYENPQVFSSDPFETFSSSHYIPTKRLPSYVKQMLKEYSIKKGDTCSISETNITMDSEVTSCGHIFEKESIQRWLSMPSSNNSCPICRQHCVL
jgi:hypothetical protein